MPLPSRRYYANNAVQQTLSASVTSSATTFTIGSSYATWPNTFPFYATVDFGQPTAEVVKVTAISGVNATVARGQNGTSAVAHSAGATFQPTVVALDLDEANAHTTSVSGVHGISGHVVGTDDAQTLSNKTLDGSTVLQDPTVTGTALLDAANVTNGATIGGNISVGGTSTLTGDVTTGHKLNVTTDATVTGKLTVGGITTLNGTLSVSDTISDKRGNPVGGKSVLSYTNANANPVTVDASSATHIVAGTWDTTELSRGDLIDQRGAAGGNAGSMKVVTAGLYEWHVLTLLPPVGAGQFFTQGLVVGGVFFDERDTRAADFGGRISSNGQILLAANAVVQIGYSQTTSSALTGVIPVRFTLSLTAAS